MLQAVDQFRGDRLVVILCPRSFGMVGERTDGDGHEVEGSEREAGEGALEETGGEIGDGLVAVLGGVELNDRRSQTGEVLDPELRLERGRGVGRRTVGPRRAGLGA